MTRARPTVLAVIALVLAAIALALWNVEATPEREDARMPGHAGHTDMAAPKSETPDAEQPTAEFPPDTRPATSRDGGSPSLAPKPSPDLDDAPVRSDDEALDQIATRRGLQRIAASLKNLQRQIEIAETEGNTERATLLRKRMTHLRARRVQLRKHLDAAAP